MLAERAYAPKLPDLMETAVAALGVKELMAHVSVRGGLLQAKGRANDLADVHARSGNFWSALIGDRRIAPAPGLGFTSGMPFLLTYSTQSAWLTDAGVPLASIGLLSELTLAYKFKFLWAPFLDQYDPPLIGRSLASFFCEASSSAAGRAAFRFAGTIALSPLLVLM
jgi:hypothetical protein